jgi:Ca-activated chloride channel family protein
MSEFHFIRPLWLLTLIPSVIIMVMLIRQKDSRQIWKGIVADHLIPYMVSGLTDQKRFRPHLLVGIALILTSLAMAGPTWKREPAPFADDTAALVIAVEVSPTMMAQDIQPSRIVRAGQKIRDLLALREGSSTALIAYSGSAHLVMPLTEDGGLVADFSDVLVPDIMPIEGDAADKAVLLAQKQLSSSVRSGSVLLVTDGVSPDVSAAIKKNQSSGKPYVHVYAVGTGNEVTVPPGSPPAPPLDLNNVKKAAAAGKGSLVQITPDKTDIEKLSIILKTQLSAASDPDDGERWKDFGYWLVPLLAFLSLWWFRPGWTIQLNPVLLILVLVFFPGNQTDLDAGKNAEEMKSDRFWFQTPDQKAQKLFDSENFEEAAELFTDPFHKGTAWYRAGNFEKAAAAFGRTGTPDGMYNRGNSLIILGNYDEAIRSYELALKEQPGWKDAVINLDIARARLAKLAPPDDAVSQKAVGEDDEPDDIVFDDSAKNRDDTNTETIAGTGEELSDKTIRALWLRNLETDHADFLRNKFAYQYMKAQKEEE